MNDPKHFSSVGVSRRSLFKIGISCLGAATVFVVAAKDAFAGKMAQKSVSYQATPKGPLRCDNCKLWEAPNACKSVEGVIAPSGWCAIYRKA